jgi:hypothetical protein
MAIDTLCFADYDPVTGRPTVDGFTGIEDAGVITSEAEPGYVLGSRLTMGGGGQGTGGGFPPMIFQCVRDGEFLNLAFFCRFAFSFVESDVIVLALKPSAASPQTDARRIDIFPVYTGVGADDPATCGGSCPDDPPKPGQPVGTVYHIRTHPQKAMKHFRGSGNPPWTTVNPNGSVYTGPDNVSCQVRSWQPPTSAGQPPEFAWSVEIRIPRDTDAGGGNWINLFDGFAIYFSLLRATVSATQKVQFTFPVGVGTANWLTGVLGAGTTIPVYGKGFIPALASPVGGNCGLGVTFINGENSVGIRPTTAAAFSALGTTIFGATGPSDNRLVAQVRNTDPTATAPGVTAEFRFANWGMGPMGFAAWAMAQGATPMPTTPSDIAPNQQVELTSDWPRASVPTAYAAHPHQCVWVQLDTHQTPPGVPVNFIQSAVRRNLDFSNLSQVRQPAEISGVGYPAPKDGSDHDFLLSVNVREIKMPAEEEPRAAVARTLAIAPSREPTVAVVWLWIVHGYRRTGMTLEIEGTKYELLDDSPGAFGAVATHDDATDVFGYQLSGKGLEHLGRNSYSLRVPQNGSVTIDTQISADTQNGASGCLPIGPLVKLWRALVNWIKKLLGQQ